MKSMINLMCLAIALVMFIYLKGFSIIRLLVGLVEPTYLLSLDYQCSEISRMFHNLGRYFYGEFCVQIPTNCAFFHGWIGQAHV